MSNQNMILSWMQTVNFVLNRTFRSFIVLAVKDQLSERPGKQMVDFVKLPCIILL